MVICFLLFGGGQRGGSPVGVGGVQEVGEEKRVVSGIPKLVRTGEIEKSFATLHDIFAIENNRTKGWETLWKQAGTRCKRLGRCVFQTPLFRPPTHTTSLGWNAILVQD